MWLKVTVRRIIPLKNISKIGCAGLDLGRCSRYLADSKTVKK
jgi:hypothetical protein